LTVVIPTLGRPGLAAAVASCAGADQVVVVADSARGPVTLPPLPANASALEVVGGDHGYTARTAGIHAATGTHLAFLDDDDVYTPDAIGLFKHHACALPVIFRMDHYHHGILWRDPVLEFGNVSTQMFVVPNDRERLGTWAPHVPGLQEPGGDYTFLRGCCERMGEPVWRDEIVAVLRPDTRGPAVTVVTPWRDHPELAPDFYMAMQALAARDRLLVVDDGSEPPQRAQLWTLEHVGFSRACNVGLAAAETDAVLFLNNDIAATRADWLEPLRAAMEPGVLVGAELRDSPHGAVDGERLPYLDGWCIGGMTVDLRDLGGWNETLDEPAYYGDNLLCLEARLAGMTLREARTGLIHKRNVTAGPATDPVVVAASTANRERFLERARDALGVMA
jgi:hypothetical protein